MKVTTETESILELKHSNWFGLLLGIALVAYGLALLVGQLLAPIRNVWIGGLVATGLGALIAVFQRFVMLTLDRGLRTVTIQSQGILGGGSHRAIEFSRIKEIIVDEQIVTRTTGGTQKERPIYNLVFHLTDGQMEAIDITPAMSTSVAGMSTDRFRKNNAVMVIGNKIAEFIGVPCTDRRPPTFGQAIEGIENIIRVAKGKQE
ncbi:MAG: hypothetical protein ACKO8Z_15120 [Prosthecobacter sp.]